jgi:hypothetical protein
MTPSTASILLLLGRLVALARPGLLRVERVAIIYWDILTNHLLDATQILAFVLITESNGDAPLAGAPRAPNTVHIDLGLVRQIQIDDVTDVRDIDAAARHVGGD